jgi:hypothetical protein
MDHGLYEPLHALVGYALDEGRWIVFALAIAQQLRRSENGLALEEQLGDDASNNFG